MMRLERIGGSGDERKTRGRNYSPDKSTDMEHPTRHASLRAEQVVPFDSPVSILVTCYRHTLADVDGNSAKAIIDGIVHCGILQDDSPKFVTQVSYEQVKVKNKSEEKTVVTLREV